MGLALLKNPTSNSRFYFDSLKNKSFKIEWLLKLDKVKDFDELSLFPDLNKIEEVVELNKDMKLLGGFLNLNNNSVF